MEEGNVVTSIRGTFGSLVPGKPTINVVAKNRGWLFEDLKDHFYAGAHRLGLGVACSDEPWPTADAWIYLRTHEAAFSPEPARTVVQIHDMFADDYGPHGPRRCVEKCGGVSFTHPEQVDILTAAGITRFGIRRMVGGTDPPAVAYCGPIGCTEDFRPRPRKAPGPHFTIGWVGRPMSYRGVDIKRCEMAVEIIAATGADCLLVGAGLEALKEALGRKASYLARPPLRHREYPELYRYMDALLITSLSEAGPLCLFEALASGVPAVSTRVGWASTMIEDGVNGYLYDSMPEAVERLERIRRDVGTWRERRHDIAATQPHRLEDWIDANLRLALELAR